MPDEDLIKELQAKSADLSYDTRYLIGELIKRYKILKFELNAQKMRGGEIGEGRR